VDERTSLKSYHTIQCSNAFTNHLKVDHMATLNGFNQQVKLVRCTVGGEFYQLVMSLNDALQMCNIDPFWWYTSADYRVLNPDVYIFTKNATCETDINWRATRIKIDLQLTEPQYEFVDDVVKCPGGDVIFCRITNDDDECVGDLDIDWFVNHARDLYRVGCPYMSMSSKHTTTDDEIVQMIGEVPRQTAWQSEQIELWRLAARLRRRCCPRRWDMFSIAAVVVSG